MSRNRSRTDQDRISLSERLNDSEVMEGMLPEWHIYKERREKRENTAGQIRPIDKEKKLSLIFMDQCNDLRMESLSMVKSNTIPQDFHLSRGGALHQWR